LSFSVDLDIPGRSASSSPRVSTSPVLSSEVPQLPTSASFVDLNEPVVEHPAVMISPPVTSCSSQVPIAPSGISSDNISTVDPSGISSDNISTVDPSVLSTTNDGPLNP
jgi:hypothetical protein